MRTPIVDPRVSVAPDPQRFSRGQVLAIFAGSLIALMLLSAMVVDLGWYWSNGLRIQRAADAAALAGAVYLPENFNGALPNAQSAALAAAKRNGYVPDADTSVTSTVDPNNPRQLNVSIGDKVGTYFMRVIGIPTISASRSSKAEFVLPVPMGSPQNYYGVGTMMGTVNTPHTTTASSTGNSGARVATTVPSGGTWSASSGSLDGAISANDAAYARTSTNNASQLWGGFGMASQLGANQVISSVDGIQVQLDDVYLSAACANTFLYVSLSWDGGNNWSQTNLQKTGNLGTSATAGDYPFGSATNLTAWAGHTWVGADLNDSNFRFAVQAVKGCSGSPEIRLDHVQITASYHITTSTTTTTIDPDPAPRVVADPGTGAALATQGFWGALITKGGSRENGDQFDPTADNMKGTANPDFDGKGVDYDVEIAGANGQLRLYDAAFCETGSSVTGGNYGAGDHWISGSPNAVTTIYTLSNQNGTPYDISDDIQVATSGNLFAGDMKADYSGNYGVPAHGGLADCATNAYHNAWYQLASGLPAGSYRLNVTSNVAGNVGTNAENMWSAWVSSASGKSQVFGQGRMVTYNNLSGGKQLFYLAQIDKVHASKTMEIKLFDPGDVSGDASLRILSPDGNAYNYVNFSWTADNGTSGSGSTVVTATTGGGSKFQDALVTIVIPLPTTYGSVGLTPSSESAFGPGWWKIEYTVAGGNDTTTWQVDIQGNPVHLLVP